MVKLGGEKKDMGLDDIIKKIGKKGVKMDCQKIFVEIPNNILMKYLPDMLKDMEKSELVKDG